MAEVIGEEAVLRYLTDDDLPRISKRGLCSEGLKLNELILAIKLFDFSLTTDDLWNL